MLQSDSVDAISRRGDSSFRDKSFMSGSASVCVLLRPICSKWMNMLLRGTSKRGSNQVYPCKAGDLAGPCEDTMLSNSKSRRYAVSRKRRTSDRLTFPA